MWIWHYYKVRLVGNTGFPGLRNLKNLLFDCLSYDFGTNLQIEIEFSMISIET